MKLNVMHKKVKLNYSYLNVFFMYNLITNFQILIYDKMIHM